MTKTCKICGIAKPLTDFTPMADMKDGHRNECRNCRAANAMKEYHANPKKRISSNKKWRTGLLQDRDRINAITELLSITREDLDRLIATESLTVIEETQA